MTQIKKLDFSGTTIYCGVDVHKKSWRVNIQDNEFELEDFSQNPDAVLLHKHLINRYPGAAYNIGYEAGFSGFNMQRTLSESGCRCWVVNAADVPASDKDKKQKHDKADARKLCAYLQTKKLKGIHIPDASWEHARTLVRTRERIVNNQTRCKNRIWQLLYFSGLPVPAQQQEGKYWSKHFIEGLQKWIVEEVFICSTHCSCTSKIIFKPGNCCWKQPVLSELCAEKKNMQVISGCCEVYRV